MKLSNKLYDSLKFIAQILLPALASLYFALAQIWNLPEPEKVVGTITVVDAFLGVILGLQASTYYKSGADTDGAINVIDTPDKTAFQLSIDTSPERLAKQERVVLKVTNQAQPEPIDAAKTAGEALYRRDRL